MVNCSIHLLVQYLARPYADPLSGLDCTYSGEITFHRRSSLSNGEEVHLEGAHPPHVGQLRVVLHGHEEQVDAVEELQCWEED